MMSKSNFVKCLSMPSCRVNLHFAINKIVGHSSAVIMLPSRNASKTTMYIPATRKYDLPEIFYSLEERLKKMDHVLKDPDLYEKVNIGLPYRRRRENISERSKIVNKIKCDIEMEKKSKDCKLLVDLYEAEKEWTNSTKPEHVKSLAENYQIFDHLFGKFAYFYPVVNMEILFDYDEETVSPVFNGNLLKPAETTTAPSVSFPSKPDDLWTLILTNPDGNLFDNEAEIIHWFLTNIPGNKIEDAEEIIPYLQPIPIKGTGFHRYIFVLYQQTQRTDFSKYMKEKPCLSLPERTFQTYDFYRDHQDVLTPAGLAWFQSDWDLSLKKFFHQVLNMKELHYEYEFPKPYIAPQIFFPLRRPFNRYLDLHRDKMEMQKLMLLKRLSKVHPFKGEAPLLPFPQAFDIDKDVPFWLQNEIRKERDGVGKYRDVYRGDHRPNQFIGKKMTPVIKFRPSSYRDQEEPILIEEIPPPPEQVVKGRDARKKK